MYGASAGPERDASGARGGSGSASAGGGWPRRAVGARRGRTGRRPSAVTSGRRCARIDRTYGHHLPCGPHGSPMCSSRPRRTSLRSGRERSARARSSASSTQTSKRAGRTVPAAIDSIVWWSIRRRAPCEVIETTTGASPVTGRRRKGCPTGRGPVRPSSWRRLALGGRTDVVARGSCCTTQCRPDVAAEPGGVLRRTASRGQAASSTLVGWLPTLCPQDSSECRDQRLRSGEVVRDATFVQRAREAHWWSSTCSPRRARRPTTIGQAPASSAANTVPDSPG